MFEIEKNIPLPVRALESEFPFAQLDVGDSFHVPLNATGATLEEIKKANSSRASAIAGIGARTAKLLGRKFSTRRTPEGVRFWRVA